MNTDDRTITGQHKTALYHEVINSTIVLVVVTAATVVDLVARGNLPQDLLGFVYGGAITYAGGRASAINRALTSRASDTGTNGQQA